MPSTKKASRRALRSKVTGCVFGWNRNMAMQEDMEEIVLEEKAPPKAKKKATPKKLGEPVGTPAVNLDDLDVDDI
jgi:hypothetical protein